MADPEIQNLTFTGTAPVPDLSSQDEPGTPAPPSVGTMKLLNPPLLSWGCTIAFDWDYGVLGMPTSGAEREAPVAIVRLHAGSCVKVVTCVATRLRDYPPLLPPDRSNPNEVLMRRRHVLFNPGRLPSGEMIYAAMCQYGYVLQVAPADGDSLPMPPSPFDVSQAAPVNPAQYGSWIAGIPWAAVSGPAQPRNGPF